MLPVKDGGCGCRPDQLNNEIAGVPVEPTTAPICAARIGILLCLAFDRERERLVEQKCAERGAVITNPQVKKLEPQAKGIITYAAIVTVRTDSLSKLK